MHNSPYKNAKTHLAFFSKSTGAPHSEEEGLMAPTSNSFFIYYFTNNYSYGLWWYSPFHTGSVPGFQWNQVYVSQFPALMVPILAATQEIHC